MTQNDTTALKDLMPRINQRARRLAQDPAEAEDMAQETALRLWQVLIGEAEVSEPDRYAMVTLHNLARQRWRARRPTEELTDDMAQAQPLAPARMACRELHAAIEALPPDQGALMRLVMMGETSPRALAERLDLPQGTVMSRLARARAQLRADMKISGSVIELL
ncbi:MAG: RNA polymerase sigma factor [Pseudomonadota bacterium]